MELFIGKTRIEVTKSKDAVVYNFLSRIEEVNHTSAWFEDDRAKEIEEIKFCAGMVASRISSLIAEEDADAELTLDNIDSVTAKVNSSLEISTSRQGNAVKFYPIDFTMAYEINDDDEVEQFITPTCTADDLINLIY